MLKGTLASAFEAAYCKASIGSVEHDFLTDLRRAGRLSLDADVMRQAERVRLNNSDYITGEEIHALVRLPFDPIWMEWKPAGAYGLADAEEYPERLGHLAYRREDGLVVIGAVLSHGRIYLSKWWAVAGDDGLAIECLKTTASPETDDETFAHTGLIHAARVLVLLSAKNAPLTIGPGEDFHRLNLQRAKAGKPALLGTRPVRWNLSRLEQKAGRGLTAEERVAATAHLCRGHIKVRKSGTYWWSPHFRCLRGEPAPENGRDHIVSDRRMAA